jgi:predicted DNA binding CopG/RHH family protein
MARAKVREVETHHNQKLTDGAATHMSLDTESQKGSAKQKVVVLRLSEAEYQAFKAKGGAKGFKAWLAES